MKNYTTEKGFIYENKKTLFNLLTLKPFLHHSNRMTGNILSTIPFYKDLTLARAQIVRKPNLENHKELHIAYSHLLRTT